MDKWKPSYSCLLLETKNRFQQFASEFWSSTEEVHRKIQLPSIEVVHFLWHGCTRSTKQVQPCTVLHRTAATRPSSTRTRKQKVKARWRTSRQPSLEQSEFFCCFSLLKLVEVFMEYQHFFRSLPLPSNPVALLEGAAAKYGEGREACRALYKRIYGILRSIAPSSNFSTNNCSIKNFQPKINSQYIP